MRNRVCVIFRNSFEHFSNDHTLFSIMQKIMYFYISSCPVTFGAIAIRFFLLFIYSTFTAFYMKQNLK